MFFERGDGLRWEMKMEQENGVYKEVRGRVSLMERERFGLVGVFHSGEPAVNWEDYSGSSSS